MAVTAAEVKNLITGCSVDDRIVESIISDATTYISNVLTDCDGLSDDEVEAITKWFAAHMLASGPHRQALREKLGEAEVEYDPQTGDGLSSTSYGRMAMALDRCGKLKASGKQGISIRAITSFE